MDNNQDRNILEIEISLIQFNPLQPRGIMSPESLTELANSIREQGILEPLIIADTPAGWQLIAGERRLRAAKIVGLKKVPVVIKTTTSRGILEMSIVENVQREDLNPIERALAYKRLIDEFGLATYEVATKVGKSIPTISNTIRLLSLPDAIKDALVAGVINEGHVRPLITLGSEALMLQVFKKVLQENSTARETEEIARNIKGKLKINPTNRVRDRLYIPEMDEMAAKIKEAYSLRKVRIDQTRGIARIFIEIKGALEETTPKVKELVEKLLGVKEI